MYVDEDGELFIIDDWIGGFFRGLVQGGVKNAWRTANKQAGISAKIWGGLFIADKNKNFIGKVGEIFSRFTRQLPQTLAGFLGAHGTNMAGTAERVDYKYGATVVKTDGNWGGITLGSYIIGDNTIEAHPDNSLFQHEYGHYLQSQSMGWAYLPRVGIPSLLSTGTHNYHPVEQDANARAIRFFHERTEGNFKWYFKENPIGVKENNWTMNDYDTEEFQRALRTIRLQVKVSIKDYISWVSFPFVVMTGINNGALYNGQPPYWRRSEKTGRTGRSSIKY